MAIWFTSDTHAYHKRIIGFCPNTRKGNDADEMTELMLQTWCEQVAPDDTVYCLGDFSFGSTDETLKFAQRLPGHWHLIYGNHDRQIRNNAAMIRCFESVQEYKRITIDKHSIILFHYPITEWDAMHYGSFHFYGHLHDRFASHSGRCYNVGIDTRPLGDMKLWEWSELRNMMLQREVVVHH